MNAFDLGSGDERIRASKLMLRYDPPSILLIYSKGNKKRRRNMPVRDLTKLSNPIEVSKQLVKKHPAQLDAIPRTQLERLVRKLIDNLSKPSTTTSNAHSGTIATADDDLMDKFLNDDFEDDDSTPPQTASKQRSTIDPEENLNALDDAELNKRKAVMNVDFEKNILRPGDDGYVYDKQIDFKPGIKSDWDNDDDDDDF